jgi:hypothetical protein
MNCKKICAIVFLLVFINPLLLYGMQNNHPMPNDFLLGVNLHVESLLADQYPLSGKKLAEYLRDKGVKIIRLIPSLHMERYGPQAWKKVFSMLKDFPVILTLTGDPSALQSGEITQPEIYAQNEIKTLQEIIQQNNGIPANLATIDYINEPFITPETLTKIQTVYQILKQFLAQREKMPVELTVGGWRSFSNGRIVFNQPNPNLIKALSDDVDFLSVHIYPDLQPFASHESTDWRNYYPYAKNFLDIATRVSQKPVFVEEFGGGNGIAPTPHGEWGSPQHQLAVIRGVIQAMLEDSRSSHPSKDSIGKNSMMLLQGVRLHLPSNGGVIGGTIWQLTASEGGCDGTSLLCLTPPPEPPNVMPAMNVFKEFKKWLQTNQSTPFSIIRESNWKTPKNLSDPTGLEYGIDLNVNEKNLKANEKKALHLIDTLGVQWLRIGYGFSWAVVEPRKGEWNFKTAEKVVAMAQKHHLKLLVELGSPPSWAAMPLTGFYHIDPSQIPPQNPVEFAEYAKAIARHFKGKIQAYKIYNEVQIHPGWNPRRYAKVLALASQAIHAEDPNAIVIGGGFWIAPKAVRFTKELFLDPKYPAGKYLNAFNIHMNRANPKTASTWIEKSRRFLQHVGTPLPIWVDEFEYPSNPQEEWSLQYQGEHAQSQFIQDMVAVCKHLKVSALFYTFLPDDNRRLPENRSAGLVTTNFKPKESFFTFEKIIQNH